MNSLIKILTWVTYTTVLNLFRKPAHATIAFHKGHQNRPLKEKSPLSGDTVGQPSKHLILVCNQNLVSHRTFAEQFYETIDGVLFRETFLHPTNCNYNEAED